MANKKKQISEHFQPYARQFRMSIELRIRTTHNILLSFTEIQIKHYGNKCLNICLVYLNTETNHYKRITYLVFKKLTSLTNKSLFFF